MSSTERLRAMLDERGVEWWPMHDVENGYYQDRDTEFVIDGKKYTAHEWGGTLNVYGLTPEQAIAATLGAGTCREVYLLMATDIGDGREEVLGVYATEEAAMAAINESQFGYALHHVRKWVVDQAITVAIRLVTSEP